MDSFEEFFKKRSEDNFGSFDNLSEEAINKRIKEVTGYDINEIKDLEEYEMQTVVNSLIGRMEGNIIESKIAFIDATTAMIPDPLLKTLFAPLLEAFLVGYSQFNKVLGAAELESTMREKAREKRENNNPKS